VGGGLTIHDIVTVIFYYFKENICIRLLMDICIHGVHFDRLLLKELNFFTNAILLIFETNKVNTI